MSGQAEAAVSWYLTVRPDAAYTRSVEVGWLVEYLSTLPELVRSGPQTFASAPGLPWAHLCFANADAAGGYAITDVQPEAVNVVELVCGDGDDAWYEALARRIAAHLGWEAVEEGCGRAIHPAGT